MTPGDDYQCPTKGSVKYPYKIDSQKSLKMKDVLYVPRLRKNLFSISALKAKGIRVSFVDGQVPMCPIGNTIEDATLVGEEDEGVYKLKGQSEQALVHEIREPNELWRKYLAHVH